MNNHYKKILILLTAPLFLVSCGGDDLDDLTAQALQEPIVTANYTYSDLVGKWNLESMTSDTEVDFNGDGAKSTIIRDESVCFDPMYFDFDDAGNVKTGQAKLYFDASGQFSCLFGEYNATYEVVGNEVTFHFQFDGLQVSETKTVTITNDGTYDYFSFKLDRTETSGYLNQDPGTTSASEIGEIEMVYKKVR